MSEQTADSILLTHGVTPEHLQAESAVWQVFGFSDRAPHRQGPGQDSLLVHFLSASHCVLAVADGVGGMKNGEIASKLTLETLRAHLIAESSLAASPTADGSSEEATEGGSARASILNSIEAAHREIREQALGAATTIALVELQNNAMRTYHVGDSSILVCGNRGRIVYRTIDHSPTGYAVESGLLDSQESLHHEQRHIISNAVGLDELRFEISLPHDLGQRDTVVVATDGLFDNLYAQEIVDIVRKGCPKQALDNLVSLSYERMIRQEVDSPSKPDDRAILVARRKRQQ